MIGDRPCWACWWRMIQPPTGAHLSSPLRPPREATPVSNLQSLCLAPPRAEPSSCAYGCLRREAYTHVLIARRAARPAQQIETSRSQMDVGSQFFSLTAGFGEGSGKRPKSSEKQETPAALRGLRVRLTKPRVLPAARRPIRELRFCYVVVRLTFAARGPFGLSLT